MTEIRRMVRGYHRTTGRLKTEVVLPSWVSLDELQRIFNEDMECTMVDSYEVVGTRQRHLLEGIVGAKVFLDDLDYFLEADC